MWPCIACKYWQTKCLLRMKKEICSQGEIWDSTSPTSSEMGQYCFTEFKDFKSSQLLTMINYKLEVDMPILTCIFFTFNWLSLTSEMHFEKLLPEVASSGPRFRRESANRFAPWFAPYHCCKNQSWFAWAIPWLKILRPIFWSFFLSYKSWTLNK